MAGSAADINTYLRPLNVALLVGFALSGGWIARLVIDGGRGFPRQGQLLDVCPARADFVVVWTLLRSRQTEPQPAFRGRAVPGYDCGAISGLVFKWLETPASTWLRARQRR